MRPLYEDPEGMACRKNLSQKEVSQLFLNDVATTIFDDGEPRTVRHLLQEYEDLLLAHGIPKTSRKTHDIKLMLEKHFGKKV